MLLAMFLFFLSINWIYRFPPTRGAAFCIGFWAFCAVLADLAALAAAAGAGAAFFCVAFAVFFNSLAALKRGNKMSTPP